MLDFRTLADEAIAQNVDLVSVGDSIDLTTANGKFFSTVLAAFAEMEAAVIANRVKESVDALRRSNRYAGGNLPFGYRSIPNPDGNGRVLDVDPTEASEVQQAAKRITSGWSIYAVMRDLNDRGIKSRRGGRWSVQALRQLLTSDAIQGRVVHRGELIRDPETGLPLEVWFPVLSTDVVEQVRARIESEKPEAGQRRRKDSARLLSGLARCAECGMPLYTKVSGARREKTPPVSYQCSARSNGGKCSGVSVTASRLDEFVVDAFLARFGHREVVEIAEVGRNEVTRAEIDRAIRDTTEAMTDDNSDVDALTSRLRLLKDQKADLPEHERETVVRGTGVLYSEAWKAAVDDTARRQLLAVNLDRLAVGKGQRGKTGPIDAGRVNLTWKKFLIQEFMTPADSGRVALPLEGVWENTRRMIEDGRMPSVTVLVNGEPLDRL